jgi:hypothetical protein
MNVNETMGKSALKMFIFEKVSKLTCFIIVKNQHPRYKNSLALNE